MQPTPTHHAAARLLATLAALLTGAALCASAPAPADDDIAPRFRVIADDHIVADGITYTSWEHYAQSKYFKSFGGRCNCAFVAHEQRNLHRSQADCTYNLTNPDAQYAPTGSTYRIPVVVHVIQNSAGVGYLSPQTVQSQIDILNEDFLAIPNTNGEPGTETNIEFFLATEDPDGNATTGITYTTSDLWFDDAGAYYNILNWDTHRYLNIYTNSASGALGYVPDLPQGGIAGQAWDRVVILYSTFGRNAPFVPFHLGRTATHEVGHYLGLWHTFDNACGTASCYTTGDRVCDTNAESSPSTGCPTSRSTCSATPSPIHNYMNYTHDSCMDRFTPEQAMRMRCSLLNWRPLLYETAPAGCEGDVNDDETIDTSDLAYVIFRLGGAGTPGAVDGDADANGQVNSADITYVIFRMGASCG